MSDNETGWVKDQATGAWYHSSDGEVTTGWNLIDGNWYYFYSDGSMTWENTVDGFYLDSSGKMGNGTGWLQNKATSTWYYYSDGEMTTGWKQSGDDWYYLNADGKMATGWIKDENGDWYYLHSDGTMATGWVKDDSGWYFLYNNGSMAHDFTADDGYHVDKSGKMVTGTGWQYVDDHWYYLKDDGEVATDWLYNQGNWYYLYPQGSMAWSTTVDGYYLDDNGEWVPDEEYIGDNIPIKVTEGAAVTYDGTEFPEENSIVNRIANGTVVRRFKDATEFFRYQLLMGMGETNGEEGVIYVTDEQEKLADAGADMLTIELGGDFVAIVANGVRAYKNIKTGEIIYNESYFAGSGAGNIAKASYVKLSEILEKAIKTVNKKWGQKGVDAFEKAMNKGIVGPEGQSGIKLLKGKPYKGKYTHEIKVKNKEYGDYRIYGYQDSDGKLIFDYFDKGLH